jgi:hypothetical protein
MRLSEVLLAALAISFSPGLADMDRRERQLRTDFAPHVAQGIYSIESGGRLLLPKPLSAELWDLVADHFLNERIRCSRG